MKLNLLYKDYYKDYLKSITTNSDDCKTVKGIEIYKSKADKELVVDLGYGEYNLSLGEDYNHMLITGHGSTIFADNIIANMVLRYSPKELELVVLDSSYIVGEDLKYPHICNKDLYTGYINFSDELRCSLSSISDIINNRRKIFLEERCLDYRDYRKRIGRLPRIVCLMYNIERICNEDSIKDLETIIKMGKEVGVSVIHVCNNYKSLRTDILKEFDVAICGKTSYNQSMDVLGSDIASHNTRSGVAYINIGGERNITVNVPFMSSDMRESITSLLL